MTVAAGRAARRRRLGTVTSSPSAAEVSVSGAVVSAGCRAGRAARPRGPAGPPTAAGAARRGRTRAARGHRVGGRRLGRRSPFSHLSPVSHVSPASHLGRVGRLRRLGRLRGALGPGGVGQAVGCLRLRAGLGPGLDARLGARLGACLGACVGAGLSIRSVRDGLERRAGERLRLGEAGHLTVAGLVRAVAAVGGTVAPRARRWPGDRPRNRLAGGGPVQVDDDPATAAGGAGFAVGLEQALADPLAGHLHQTQRGHLGDLVLGAVPARGTR